MAVNKSKKNADHPQPLDYASAPLAQQHRWDLATVWIWLLCGHFLLVLAAGLVLYSGIGVSAGNELSVERAMFSAANALTLTGFQSAISINTYLLPGRLLILALTLIGAIIPMAVGGLAVVRIARLPYSDRQVIRAALVACGILVLIGALPLVSQDASPLEAVMLSASAFGNSGLYFGRLPVATSWQTHLVLMPLAVLGGLGLPVLMELANVIHLRGGISSYGRTVLRMTAVLYLFGFFLCLLARWMSMEFMPAGHELTDLVGTTSVASLNSRTAGFPFQFVQEFPRMMEWLLIPLMIIGGSPASTAGGLKTTTIVVLGRGIRRLLRGQAPPRGLGLALVWTGIYIALVMVVFLLLLWTDPQLPSDRLLFETVSAISNVGLSYDTIMVVGRGLTIMTFAMLLGRVIPLGILWWMVQISTEEELPVG